MEDIIADRGSIPALAGERIRAWTTRSSSWVYPRACGGTVPSDPEIGDKAGLSPRLRGNVQRGRTGFSSAGSIPALAGERSSGRFRD